MKKMSCLFLMLLTTLVLIGCENRNVGDGFESLPTKQSLSQLRAQGLQNIKQVKKYTLSGDPGEFIRFQSAQGVELSIQSACLRKNGQPVTGEVVLEFIEIYDRADMLTTNIATMGKRPDGTLNALETGGAFNLKLKQDGVELTTSCDYSISVPADLTGGLEDGMLFWKGTLDTNRDLVWNLVNDVEVNIVTNGGEAEVFNMYNVHFNDFDWFNIDKFWEESGEKTSVAVKVPNHYGGENSAVYFALKGETNSLAQFRYMDYVFQDGYGYLPVGEEGYVIFVSERDGQWLYAVQPITITSNHFVEIKESDMTAATLEVMKRVIRSLP